VKPLRRVLLHSHRWLGLLLVLPLGVPALSGTLLAAGKPLDEWLNRHLFLAPGPAVATAPIQIDNIHAELTQRYGPRAGFTLRLPQQAQQSLRVFVRAEGFSGMAFYDPATARWLGQRGDTASWWPWLFELHSTLLIGEAGKGWLAASAAALLLLLLLGGLLGWPGQGRSAFGVTWRAAAPRRWRDLHRVGGLGLLPLLLVLVASGLYMGWTPLRGWVSAAAGDAVHKPPRLPASHEGAASVPLSVLVARALEPWPQGRVVYLTLRSGQPVRVRVKLPHDPHPNGLSSAWFDPRDGRELARVRVEQLDAGQRWVSWIYPLHSAQLLGPPQRVAWVLLGSVLVVLAGSGVWLWARRARACKEGVA
jgi:uncharacterized iron-regulated membrane protein